ncbi:polynucleotide 5'-hydroxyl-kinase NOL9 [Corythoichthys intestinalis]|uniref:polynucleotide 5'-hydroxyl-kinase NOL9 n=1 Tax=Corythoichthys intestinalis TaxID=161448 RepID=UPI0025A5E10A|nr:polynucleotide 5'-hydroxyl-kinase NOL9 [Corythoichthys intestinalis]XP_057685411.1 polynucleotide 5'-hydroxyl-kinase NOL9 [Corythoichthys intestinalis]XP_061802039.1 polynucleotide 5'-hydroxyl-kinase NOL9-like [Nerophis lumbriciformis]
MKAKKSSLSKGSATSQKWKDVRGKRCRPPPVVTSDLNSSPVMVRMIKEHQECMKKKPTVKRLKSKAKPVSGKTVTQTKSFTNGDMGLDSDEFQDWKEYSQSVQVNGLQTQAATEDGRTRRLDGNSLHQCAERDDQRKHAVLIMQKGQALCFRGKCYVTCLYGRVEVLGFTIEEGQQSYPLFSPASHCPLTIRATERPDDSRDHRTEATDILSNYLPPASQKKLLKKVVSNSSIILLEPMETPLTRFLSSFTDLSNLFDPPAGELMSAILDTPLNGLGMIPLVSDIEGLKVSESCRESLNAVVSACKGDLDACAVVLVYGAKNVGKSTYVRMVINTLLNHTTSVDYLEADLGQTEFTPAGCLSLVTVKEPLLGPPFTHQRDPDHMVYYGDTSCESDLSRYMESLKSLWRRRSPSGETPIIINTMGWVKGFGLQLLVDMLRFFPVSHVIHLTHGGGTTQSPALTPEFLRTAQGFHTQPPAQTALDEFTDSARSPSRGYFHMSVQSDFEGVGCQGTAKHQRTNEQRDLSLLAYLGQLQSADPGPVRQLHSLTPYQVPHTDVALVAVHFDVAPSHIFYAANSSLVGLCILAEKVASKGGPVLLSRPPICPCVGLGVLRGIDMARGLYFVLTPVDPAILRKVNCLLLGATSLPSCILTAQGNLQGELPYVTSDYSFDLTGAGKLRIFKGLQRPSQTGTR